MVRILQLFDSGLRKELQDFVRVMIDFEDQLQSGGLFECVRSGFLCMCVIVGSCASTIIRLNAEWMRGAV